jgi:TAG lipase/steryl ester hydrolase/phospholipase A2/LPA acyltransferase
MLINSNLKLRRDLKSAANYLDWCDAALAFDRHNGLERWRKSDYTRQYDFVSIRMRLDQLRALKARHDTKGLLDTLNEGIHGNMGGMGKPGLYSYAKSGTKLLIQAYIEEVVHTLELLAADDSGEVSFAEKLDFFRRASHCYGRSAFMMSGSGSLLFFHVGVVKALADNNLLPTILSGSSGGSLVGAMVATHTDKELAGMLNADHFAEFFPQQGRALSVTSPEQLEQGLARFIPDLTFLQAFDKTGRSMNVSVAPAETHQTSRLLNAITSPSVLMRSAVLASCAVPGFFPPVTLQALNSYGERSNYLPSRRWVDGSVSDDLPAKRLARLYGVNHYVVSQTNPHVLPFVRDGHRKQGTAAVLVDAARRSTREWLNAMTIITSKLDKKGRSISRFNSLIRSVINQDYMGDINILPANKFPNPLRILTIPSPKEMARLITTGERSTWPKLEMIQQQTRISRKLDEILENFEGRQTYQQIKQRNAAGLI